MEFSENASNCGTHDLKFNNSVNAKAHPVVILFL